MTAEAGGARSAAARDRVPVGPVAFDLDPLAVAAAREAVRRAWRYEEVDAVPFTVDLYPAVGETLRDVLLDDEAWFSCGVRRIERSLRTIGADYIPLFEPPWTAYYTLPAVLGAQLWWEDDPTPGRRSRRRWRPTPGRCSSCGSRTSVEAAHIPRTLERLRIAAACLPPEVAIGGMDMMSPFGDVQAVTDQTKFFMALKREPEAIHHACRLVTRLQVALQDAAVEAVGDERHRARRHDQLAHLAARVGPGAGHRRRRRVW